jgi:hypothetical protein
LVHFLSSRIILDMADKFRDNGCISLFAKNGWDGGSNSLVSCIVMPRVMIWVPTSCGQWAVTGTHDTMAARHAADPCPLIYFQFFPPPPRYPDSTMAAIRSAAISAAAVVALRGFSLRRLAPPRAATSAAGKRLPRSAMQASAFTTVVPDSDEAVAVSIPSSRLLACLFAPWINCSPCASPAGV